MIKVLLSINYNGDIFEINDNSQLILLSNMENNNNNDTICNINLNKLFIMNGYSIINCNNWSYFKLNSQIINLMGNNYY